MPTDFNENNNGNERSEIDGILSLIPAMLSEYASERRSVLRSENIPSYGSVANNSNNNNVINGDDSLVNGEIPNHFEDRERTDFVDIEEGEGDVQHNPQQQRRGRLEGQNHVETVHSDGDENPNQEGPQQQQQQSSSRPETVADDEDEPPQQTRDGAIGHLTRRLRCVFSAITFPIVPLGTLVALAFLRVIYAASSLDLQKTCSQPLHSYSVLSVLLVAYIPNHAQIRSQIFQYSRDRDGPIRPTRVRLYDQFFHTFCLLYVYGGVVLMNSCRNDLSDPEVLLQEGLNNSCEVTCPNLYQALNVYVATLELFTSALILPLLFIPCIYLWFLQRASAEANEFARLQAVLQDEDAVLCNGGVTTGEILNSLETVKIVRFRKGGSGKDEPIDDVEQQQVWVVPHKNTTEGPVDYDKFAEKSEAKECCICMSEFDVDVVDLPTEESEDAALLGGPVEENDDENDDERSPLLQTDVCDDFPEGARTIVRTKCGHIFYKECLKDWIGGRFSVSTNGGGNNGGNGDTRGWKKRKARQIHCPLCREDLRPNSKKRTQFGSSDRS